MIGALLLWAQAATSAPAAAPVAESEIVVIAQRLKGWAGKVNDTLGIRTCRTTRSTGDAEIDKIGCRVLTDCFAAMKPQMIAAAKAAGRDKDQRRAAQAPIDAELTACFKERRETLVAELVARRHGSGG